MFNAFALDYGFHESIDSIFNLSYGIFLCFWSTIFIESWKRKQTKLIHIWDMDCLQDVLLNDERKGAFKYMYEYNSDVNIKMKVPIGKSKSNRFFHVLFNCFMITISFLTMLFFENYTYEDVDEISGKDIV